MSKIFEALMRAEEDRATEESEKKKAAETDAAAKAAATAPPPPAPTVADVLPMPDVNVAVDPVTFAATTEAASGFAASRDVDYSVKQAAVAEARGAWATPAEVIEAAEAAKPAEKHIETYAHVVTPQPEVVTPVVAAAGTPAYVEPAASFPAAHEAPAAAVVAEPAYVAPAYVAPVAASAPVAAGVPAAVAQETEPAFRHTVRRAEATSGFEVWHPDAAKLPALSMRGNQVEQFRSLRSKLFEYRDLNTLKSVLVSSGLPAEGKSFVAVNLAITFARHKAARVLLIDGDLRRSSLHDVLGCPGGPGLVDYLSGKVALNQIMQRGKADSQGKALPPGLSTLTFIPAGEAGDKAADLSNSARFAELIQTLSPQFDWIVVDSSPVNLVTDGANFARACDGTLLIARGGMTKFESVQRAMGELKASRLLGVVLNAVENPPLAEGYYGYDQYEAVKE